MQWHFPVNLGIDSQCVWCFREKNVNVLGTAVKIVETFIHSFIFLRQAKERYKSNETARLLHTCYKVVTTLFYHCVKFVTALLHALST